jgi:hypothetical protein
VTEVTNLKLAYQSVDGVENAGTLLGDLRADHSAVGPLAPTSDETQQLQPIQ